MDKARELLPCFCGRHNKGVWFSKPEYCPAHYRAAVQAALDEAVTDFAAKILHGDLAHRAWLTKAALDYCAGNPIDRPEGSGNRARAEAAEAKLARAVEILESALDAFEGLAAYENTNPWCEEIRNFLAELQEGGGANDPALAGPLGNKTPAVADASFDKALRKSVKIVGEAAPPTCRAAWSDGECIWEECPQARDGEPAKSGRSCPLWSSDDDPYSAEAAPPCSVCGGSGKVGAENDWGDTATVTCPPPPKGCGGAGRAALKGE